MSYSEWAGTPEDFKAATKRISELESLLAEARDALGVLSRQAADLAATPSEALRAAFYGSGETRAKSTSAGVCGLSTGAGGMVAGGHTVA